MRQSQLNELNLQYNALYRAWRGQGVAMIAKELGLGRQRLYRVLARAEADPRVVKSVELKIQAEMRKEDEAYGVSKP